LIGVILAIERAADAIPQRAKDFARVTLDAMPRLAGIRREDYADRLLVGEQLAGDLAPFCRTAARLLGGGDGKGGIRERDLALAGDRLGPAIPIVPPSAERVTTNRREP
jgi:hypothetical protein